MSDLLICPLCKVKNHRKDVMANVIRGRYYCKECFKKQKAIDEEKEKEKQQNLYFADRICFLFGLKVPGPLIYTQRKKLQEQGYTDEEILYTLEYAFTIRKLDKKKETLGIVPYMYEDATKWQKKLQQEEDRKVKAFGTFIEPPRICIPKEEVPNPKPKEKKTLEEMQLEQAARAALILGEDE